MMSFLGAIAGASTTGTEGIRIRAGEEIATVNRSHLLGLNIAVYNSPTDYQRAIDGPIKDLDVGLVRIPGGSVSDKFYWNGHGVIEDGQVDQTQFLSPYWQVDFSDYAPGFAVDNHDWSQVILDPGYNRMDARTMHEITRKHPLARNLVTVNAGTGTPELAAEWVRWANIENDYNVTYWEIGNELNGEWEAGHVRPDGTKITPEKYAKIFIEFATAMKAVDPAIKVGGPSSDIRHHEDYFEPLLRLAGDQVDFLTLHFYSLRDSLAPEDKLFEGLFALKPVTERLEALLGQYQPERKDEIELSITEWNSKLPKDQDAYRLFNSLWFSAWFGEMIKAGIDSATLWDTFSGDDNGHGLLVEQEGDYVPTGRYWAFWLWSHFMADTLVQTESPEGLHTYATRDEDTLYVMTMNPSRTQSYSVTLELDGFEPSPRGKEITLSSREYFWNPYADRADWNSGPRVQDRAMVNGMAAEIPPYCVKVFQFNRQGSREPALEILLPETGYADLPREGWVRLLEQGSNRPYPTDRDAVYLSVEGPAELSTNRLSLKGGAARFTLAPTGPGTVTVRAQSEDLTVKHSIEFTPVEWEKRVVWDFEQQELGQSAVSHYTCKTGSFAGRNAIGLYLPGVVITEPKDHVFAIEAIPEDVPLERIGGVVFDIFVPDAFTVDDDGANMQAVLQSHGAYWIPCGVFHLDPLRGRWHTLSLEIPDKKFLKVINQTFSIRFLMATAAPTTGPIYLDNIGFLLRPE